LAVSNAAAEGFVAGGRRGMLEAMLQQELKLYPQGNQLAYTIAMTYALSGNRDQALRYLQASLAKGESTVLAARMDPAWKDLHSDPGYRRLMAEIGFR
jgi:hypothetical protein